MSTAHEQTSARGLFYTLVALVLLAGLSLALRYASLGASGLPVALGIAAVKAALVAVFFMEIGLERASARLAILAGLGLFVLLLTLLVTDIVTRRTPPRDNPPGFAHRDRG